MKMNYPLTNAFSNKDILEGIKVLKVSKLQCQKQRNLKRTVKHINAKYSP